MTDANYNAMVTDLRREAAADKRELSTLWNAKFTKLWTFEQVCL